MDEVYRRLEATLKKLVILSWELEGSDELHSNQSFSRRSPCFSTK